MVYHDGHVLVYVITYCPVQVPVGARSSSLKNRDGPLHGGGA